MNTKAVFAFQCMALYIMWPSILCLLLACGMGWYKSEVFNNVFGTVCVLAFAVASVIYIIASIYLGFCVYRDLDRDE